jgi:hypothetical protein
MLKKVVLSYFDPGREQPRPSLTAKALGITPGAISQWGEIIPELQARRIAEITRGDLPFRPELYERVA